MRVMVNHLRAWREHRGLTQEALARAVGATKSAISKLEAGDRQLTERWLNKLARPLKTGAAALLAPPPVELSTGISPALTNGGANPPYTGRIGTDEVGDTDVTEAELLVLDILRDLPKTTQRNIIRAAIRQLDHVSEEERKAAHPRRRA